MFLDFYTKGILNGWEQTPRVRISVLRFNQVSESWKEYTALSIQIIAFLTGRYYRPKN
jgi:hypothetical protein